MWKPKWLVFIVIVIMLQQIKAQDESYDYPERQSPPQNPQIINNFFLSGSQNGPYNRPYWKYGRINQQDYDWDNCGCPNCPCKTHDLDTNVLSDNGHIQQQAHDWDNCGCPNCPCKTHDLDTKVLSDNGQIKQQAYNWDADDCGCPNCPCKTHDLDSKVLSDNGHIKQQAYNWDADDCGCPNCPCKTHDLDTKVLSDNGQIKQQAYNWDADDCGCPNCPCKTHDLDSKVLSDNGHIKQQAYNWDADDCGCPNCPCKTHDLDTKVLSDNGQIKQAHDWDNCGCPNCPCKANDLDTKVLSDNGQIKQQAHDWGNCGCPNCPCKTHDLDKKVLSDNGKIKQQAHDWGNCGCPNCPCKTHDLDKKVLSDNGQIKQQAYNWDNCGCPNCPCKTHDLDADILSDILEALKEIDVDHFLPVKSEDCNCKDCDCDECDCKNCDCKRKDVIPSAINLLKQNNIIPLGNEVGKRLFTNMVQKFVKTIFADVPSSLKCESCSYIMDVVLYNRRHPLFHTSDKTLKDTAEDLCNIFKDSKEFCKGILDLNFKILTYIVDSRPDLTGDTICRITGQAIGCFIPRDSDQFNSWEIKIPPPLNTFKPNTNENLNTNPLQILQISDIHYDPKYKEGNKLECEEPICCRTKANIIDFVLGETAGPWGHYKKCDIPMKAVRNLMNQASTNLQDIEYVYFTGDVVPHNIWETSIELNSRSIIDIYSLFKKTFVDKNVMVYPILGNHEFNPLDSNPPKNAPSEFSQQWLFDLVAKIWGDWLPAETAETIKLGGFYTVVPKPGFRIIALNSNVAYVYNWWLLLNDTDPYGQLQWLADTLYLAEQNNEYVHILSHVPPGEKDTYAKWAYEYERIIQRFAHIITGQFCGHTHNVQMYYFYKPNNSEYPVNIMYNGGSVTTYQDNNPNYRIYEVHPETMAVENFNDVFYNLTEANKNGIPIWYKNDFKQAFGLSSMSNQDMGQLINKMVNNKSYLQTYFGQKVRWGDTSLQEGCDDSCMIENLCLIFKTVADSDELCKYYVNIFKSNQGILD